ncbi:CsbD family protein [Corynebacterium heidelbergense]|uniref:CsbD family protein n=1 Tax=Corynebacterium heidelbergense TaxID=2055947 RepID=A0A364VDH0_9CORY|nr:CsbD family protein [Corynebacterium heidelbergense]RAV33090.1 CsbD family protein [Corynebacterium heidelbergense]RAV34671.1 CsbD family protein [Corynebacterium heidelbergense]WCZ36243.1 CsbD-like protein [Corynebacterium heidelbergense]
MSTDELKNKAEQFGGKAKEAAGDATGNESLKSEGKADQGAGKVKEKANEAKNKVAGKLNDILDN